VQPAWASTLHADDGPVEVIRSLQLVRRSAVKVRI
jgi:hypothetical protein